MPNFRFKDSNIHFQDLGSGPAVVLIHGFLESISMWTKITPILSKKMRIISIDLPGHGNSDCIGYIHTMDEMAEVIYSILKSLKLRKASIVGHSMGGYVALAFAEHYPDMIRNIVLYQSTAKSDSDWKKKDRERAIELIKENHKAFIRQSIPMLFRSKNRKEFSEEIKALKEEALNTSKQGIIAALTGMKERPNREILLKFSPYPVHIIASDMDPRIPKEESEYLASLSDKVHLHLISGCGHMSYIEAFDETVRHLKTSLS